MKKSTSKLALKTQTVRILDGRTLDIARGAAADPLSTINSEITCLLDKGSNSGGVSCVCP